MPQLKLIKNHSKFNYVVLVIVALALVLGGFYVVFRSHAATINADINSDGRVDIFDLSVLAANYNKGNATFSQGDINGDGKINILDLSLIASNWGQAPSLKTANTYVLRSARLLGVKQNLSQPQYQTPYIALISSANYYMNTTVSSVMDKTEAGASGDKHDYLSPSAYFWPNPNTADGLPYIYLDGQVNPDYNDPTKSDHPTLLTLVNATNSLSEAYYFSDQPQYAAKAEQLINAWFIAPATKMNPNLNYAQYQRGSANHGTGSAPGVIEFSDFPQLIDDVKILQTSSAWTAADHAGFTTWCNQYLNWLQTSPFGISETANTANHGTWANAQIASTAEFLGNHAEAAAAVNKVKVLMDGQIKSDGTQPYEMARTKPWNYSTFNLEGLMSVSQIGLLENINLWTYAAPGGGSIHKALDFLAPYANGSKNWQADYPYDIAPPPFAARSMTIQLRQAASAYFASQYSTDADLSQGTKLNTDFTPLLY